MGWRLGIFSLWVAGLHAALEWGAPLAPGSCAMSSSAPRVASSASRRWAGLVAGWRRHRVSRTTRADVGALHSKAPHGHPLVGNSALLGKDDSLLLLSRDWACSTCRMLKLGTLDASVLAAWAGGLECCVGVAGLGCVFVCLCPRAAVIRLRVIPKKTN